MKECQYRFPWRNCRTGSQACFRPAPFARACSRGEVPKKTSSPALPLAGTAILIVDGQSLAAADISERLLTLGARVHVVSGATRAMAVVRAKRLDMALIGPAPEDAPAALKRTLDEYAVPYVITATSRTSEPNYERIFSLSLRGNY